MAIVLYDADKAKASADGLMKMSNCNSGVGGSQTQIERT